MIEDAQRIFDFMPLEYKTQSESDYIAFLWDAFVVNYEKEKYQFAYIAYHMIFMSYVYFQLAKIYQNRPDELKNMMVFTGQALQEVEKHEKKVQESTSPFPPQFNPFRLSLEYESSIIGLFIAIGCNREIIKKMKGLIKTRNDIAHSNGSIVFKSLETIDAKIEEILECAECIQENTNAIIGNCYMNFLSKSGNPEEREMVDEGDQVREVFIRGNYLCTKDIQFACQHDISLHSSEIHFSDMEKLHLKLEEMYPNEENI